MESINGYLQLVGYEHMCLIPRQIWWLNTEAFSFITRLWPLSMWHISKTCHGSERRQDSVVNSIWNLSESWEVDSTFSARTAGFLHLAFGKKSKFTLGGVIKTDCDVDSFRSSQKCKCLFARNVVWYSPSNKFRFSCFQRTQAKPEFNGP